MTSSSVLTLAGYGCAALIAAEFYLLPAVIGWARRVPHLRTVAVIDLTLGWSVIGWIVAVTLALRPVPRGAPETAQDRVARQAAGGAGMADAFADRSDRGLRQPEAAPPLLLPAAAPRCPPRRATGERYGRSQTRDLTLR